MRRVQRDATVDGEAGSSGCWSRKPKSRWHPCPWSTHDHLRVRLNVASRPVCDSGSSLPDVRTSRSSDSIERLTTREQRTASRHLTALTGAEGSGRGAVARKSQPAVAPGATAAGTSTRSSARSRAVPSGPVVRGRTEILSRRNPVRASLMEYSTPTQARRAARHRRRDKALNLRFTPGVAYTPGSNRTCFNCDERCKAAC
jgi:hypothetical protein